MRTRRRNPLPVSFPVGRTIVRASATQTPAFKRWFRGSVVVDKNGDPRVMFHGTDAGGPFTVFEPGRGRKNIAAFFSETEDHAHMYGRNIYPVYLSVKRPFDYRKDKKEIKREVENFYRTCGGIKEPWVVNALLRRYDTALSDSEYEQADDDALPSSRLRAATVVSALLAGDWRTFEDEGFVEYLRYRGYDAVVMTELGNVNYAIFDPRQVKSASGNVGTFDPNDPDIRHNPKQRTRTTMARRNPSPYGHEETLRLSRGTLQTPDGPIKMHQIGKGSFSVAMVEDEVPAGRDPRVFLFSADDVYDKELLAMAHEVDPSNPHLPKVERFGYTQDKAIFVMPLYKAPFRKTDSPVGWRDYTLLKKCREKVYGVRKSGYEVNEDVYACAEAAGVRPLVLEALRILIDTAANYGSDYVFEFSPRNLATDDAGNLVLLDVLYDRERLAQMRREAAKKYAVHW